MSFFNSAVKLAEEAWVYYRQPAEADSLFKALPSRRDLMSELKQARDAYQLAVGQEVTGLGFFEELAAQTKDEGSGEILLVSAGAERKQLSLAGSIYSFVKSPSTFFSWGEFRNLKA